MFSLARSTVPLATKFRPFLAPSLFRSLTTEATAATPLPATSALKPRPQKPYMIHRSQTGNLPIYQEKKNGGNKLQTRIRKVEGDARVLRDELIEEMGFGREECVWHQLTNNVVVKGHKRVELIEALTAKGF